MTEAQADTILRALYLCEMEMDSIGGCTITDRPDLPLSEVGFKPDFSAAKTAVADARRVVLDALPRNVVLHEDGSIRPPRKHFLDPAKSLEAPPDTCTHGRGR